MAKARFVGHYHSYTQQSGVRQAVWQSGDQDFTNLSPAIADAGDMIVGIALWRNTSSDLYEFEVDGQSNFQRSNDGGSGLTIWNQWRSGLFTNSELSIDEGFLRFDPGASNQRHGSGCAWVIKAGPEYPRITNHLGAGNNNEPFGPAQWPFSIVNGNQSYDDFPARPSPGEQPGNYATEFQFANGAGNNFGPVGAALQAIGSSEGQGAYALPGDILLAEYWAFAPSTWCSDIDIASGYSEWTKDGYDFNSMALADSTYEHHFMFAHREVTEAGWYQLEVERVTGSGTATHTFGRIHVIRPTVSLQTYSQRDFLVPSVIDRGSWTDESSGTTNLHQKIEPADASDHVVPLVSLLDVSSGSTTARKVGDTTGVAVAAQYNTSLTAWFNATHIRFRARCVGDVGQVLNVCYAESNDIATTWPATNVGNTERQEIIIDSTSWKEYTVVMGKSKEGGAQANVTIAFERAWWLHETVGDASNYTEIECSDTSVEANAKLYTRGDETDDFRTNWTEVTTEDVILEILGYEINGDTDNDSTYVESDAIGSGTAPQYSSALKCEFPTSGLDVVNMRTDLGLYGVVRVKNTTFTPQLRLEVGLAEDGVQIDDWWVVSTQGLSTAWDDKVFAIPGTALNKVKNFAKAEIWFRGGTLSENATGSRIQISALNIAYMPMVDPITEDLKIAWVDGTIAAGDWLTNDSGTDLADHLFADGSISLTSYIDCDMTGATAGEVFTACRLSLPNFETTPSKYGMAIKIWTQNAGQSDPVFVSLYEGTTRLWGPIFTQDSDSGVQRQLIDVPPEVHDMVTDWDDVEIRLTAAQPGDFPNEGSPRVHGVGLMYYDSGFPKVKDISKNGITGGIQGTQVTVTFPDYESGDVVVIAVTTYNNGTTPTLLDTPTGWSSRALTSTSRDPFLQIFARVMDGTEGSSVVISASSGTANFAYIATSVYDHGAQAGNNVLATDADGNTGDPNPPNNVQSESKKYLWLVLGGAERTTGTDPTVIGGPDTDYHSFVEQTLLTTPNKNLAQVVRELEATSLNPTTFDTDGTQGDWVAATIAIPPKGISPVTHSTDAILKAEDVTKTHTTDASIQVVVTVTHDTDALLQAVDVTETHDTDALLALVVTLDQTTDALLKLVVELDHTTEASLFGTIEDTHTTDAILALQVELDHTADARLVTPQLIAPVEDISTPSWETFPTPGEDHYEQVNEATASESDYVFWDGG